MSFVSAVVRNLTAFSLTFVLDLILIFFTHHSNRYCELYYKVRFIQLFKWLHAALSDLMQTDTPARNIKAVNPAAALVSSLTYLL